MKNCETCQHASYCSKKDTGKACKASRAKKISQEPASTAEPTIPAVATAPTTSAKAAYRVSKFRLSYVREPDNGVLGKALYGHRDVVDFCRSYLSHLPIEKFLVIALGARCEVIGFTDVDGQPNQCAVYPAEVFRFLLSAGASNFIIAHNHPSFTLSPSEQDWDITERLLKAGKLLNIPMLDHVLVAEDKAVSLKDSSRWFVRM